MSENLAQNGVIDSKQRLQALDINTSFCVQAPAGSGKTELLTQRILKLLTICERPEEILAFTFTKKAAAEMRNRLLQSLHNANLFNQAEIEVLPPHSKLTHELATEVLLQNQRRKWHLLENTQRLRINTIDSFNAYITNQLPITSEFGAQPETSTEMTPVFQKAVQAMLSYLDDGTEISGHITTLLKHLDNNLPVVQKLLCNLLHSRDHWLGLVIAIKQNPASAREILADNFSELIEENLNYANELLEPIQNKIIVLLKFAAGNLDANGDTSLQSYLLSKNLPTTSAQKSDEWIILANFFLTQNGSLRKSVTVRNGFPAPSTGRNPEEKKSFKHHKILFTELSQYFNNNNEIHELFLLLQNLPGNSYHDNLWQVLAALTEILPFLVAHLDTIQKQLAIVDYVKVSSAALDALGTEEQPTDLTMRLDYQIKHILVDEFQDTSSLQSKLLEKLTWGWQSGDGRTLFIVGDGMQSCYSFRHANVGLFLSARDHGIGSITLESLQLQVNFRSEAAVVNWVNQVFSHSFPAQDDIGRGAVSYSESHALRPSSEGAGVETILWVSDKDAEISSRDKKLIEADCVVTQVEAITTEHPGQSIALLVRTRSHLAEIIPALREAGLAWNANDIDTLAAYTEINDLLTLTKALLNLTDTTAWLALLRTPFIGLALADIHRLARHSQKQKISLWNALANYDSQPSLNNLSHDAVARLQRVVPVLIYARQIRQRQSCRDWLEAIWFSLGGPATLSEKTDLSYIETFFQTLESESSHGDILDMHAFEDKLASIYVSSKQNKDVSLQIMTIHNAKGLEFDFVIIPGLDRTTRSSDNPLIIWQQHLNPQGEEKLILSLLNQKGEALDPGYRYLKYEAGLRNQMENTRLLYIAITRAAKKVILLGHVKSKKDELTPPAKTSLLGTIWQQLLQPIDEVKVNLIYLADELAEPQQSSSRAAVMSNQIILQRLTTNWQHPAPLHCLESSLNVEEHEPESELVMFDKPHLNLLEKKIGDIIHYTLKCKVEENLDLENQVIFNRLELNWQLQLKPVCLSSNSMDNAIATIKHNLQSCLAYAKAEWLFNHRHDSSSCEFSISDYRHAYRREYIIDRSFIDEQKDTLGQAQKVRWIIDYKSSSKPAEQSMQEFLKCQTEKYQAQLKNYADLFYEMEGCQVKTALFFTSLPYFHVLN